MKYMRSFVLRLGLVLVLVLSLISSCARADKPLTAAELLDLGEKYLLQMDYEQALVQFNKVIEIEPMNPRGYTGAAEAYVGLGRTKDAIAVLRQGLESTKDDGVRDMLDGLSNVDEVAKNNTIEQNQTEGDEVVGNDVAIDTDLSDKESPKQQPLEGYPKTERSQFEWNIHDEGSYSINEFNEFGKIISQHAYTSSDILDCFGIYTYDEYGNLLEIRWEYLRANELRDKPSVNVSTYENDKLIKITADYNDGETYYCEYEYTSDYENAEQPYQWTTYYYDSSGNLDYYDVEKHDYTITSYNPDGTLRD